MPGEVWGRRRGGSGKSTCMALEGCDELTRALLHVPNSNGVVLTAADEEIGAGHEAHPQHRPRVFGGRCDLLAALQLLADMRQGMI